LTTSFPSSADSFTNPSATDETDDLIGARTHSQFHADVNDAVEAIEAYLLSGAGIETWHYVGGVGEPAFENSWANLGFGQQKCAYRKVGSRVFLVGAATGGADGTTIFTLPSGYRPTNTAANIAGYHTPTGSTAGFAGITVSTAGAVATTLPSNPDAIIVFAEALSWFSLDTPDRA